MSKDMTQLDMQRINKGIADRSDVFYWQTDRALEPAEAGLIWADRHRYFTDNELMGDVNKVLDGEQVAEIEPHDPEAQTNLGNVNSVRVGRLASGSEVIIRCHPRGVLNGYFYAETAAANRAKQAGIPTYGTLAIHDFEGKDDFAFQVIEKLPGMAVQRWLEAHPDDEAAFLPKIGAMMARLHQVKVDGFGPFDNERAKTGQLVGIHPTLASSVRAGLSFNLDVLVKEGLIDHKQVTAIMGLFSDNNPHLARDRAVLVHNDFADWNLLTDGKGVTDLLDWDECVASDPAADVACWSTFFQPERLEGFLKGYWKDAQKPADFDERFELFRLRYVLSKMTLRIRRYSWSPTEEVRSKIEAGKSHLALSLKHFDI